MKDYINKWRESGIGIDEATRRFRKVWIETVLEAHRWNQIKAAAELKMHRNTLRLQMIQLDIQVPMHKPIQKVIEHPYAVKVQA